AVVAVRLPAVLDLDLVYLRLAVGDRAGHGDDQRPFLVTGGKAIIDAKGGGENAALPGDGVLETAVAETVEGLPEVRSGCGRRRDEGLIEIGCHLRKQPFGRPGFGQRDTLDCLLL